MSEKASETRERHSEAGLYIRLSNRLRDELDALARANERTVTQEARLALRLHLDAHREKEAA
jgi:hypothetical protein